MRIAYLAPANSTHSRRWLRRLEADGHPVLWMSIHAAVVDLMADLKPNVTFVPLHASRGLLGLIRQMRQARKLVREFGADVLHVHSMGRYGLVGAAVGVPTVTTAWGSDVVLAGPLRRPVLRWMIRRSTALTCDADHLRRRLIRLGARPEAVHLIYFGVEVDEFDAVSADERRALRRGLELPGGPIVVSLRTLEPLYDVDTLVRAMPEVLRQRPDALCVVVGGGSERGRLEALARELGVESPVRFVGRLPLEDVRRMLQVADVYVSTALSDGGLAASTAEAMASRLPVIVSDAAENRRWVFPGENGWLFPTRDHETLARLIVAALADPEGSARVGENARATIADRNNVAVEMAKAEALLRDAVR